MPAGWRRCILILTVILQSCYLTFSQSLNSEEFSEELKIRSLRDGKVASRFSFKTLLRGAIPRNPDTLLVSDESQHYTVFPLALGQILREYAVTELHLTLNAGNWNYDRWGYPEESGVGTGAELWAWMGDGAPITIDQRWKGLRNALAGLFCASLGSLDEQRTTSPASSFSPHGLLPEWNHTHQIRHASLPSEHVCTENLTPFLKLLPCKSLSGIASLLNPHKVFDADWHGMGVHVLWRGNEGVELRLTFELVSDPLRPSSVRKRDWSFRSLFGKIIERSCPVADSSNVIVSLPSEEAYSILPTPSLVDGDLAIFDLQSMQEPLDISLGWQSDFEYPSNLSNLTLLPLSIQRTLRGSSQARGQLSVVVTNNLAETIQVIYLETMPWLLQFYLHTLRVHSEGVPRDDLISYISYIPPMPHSHPATFESLLTLPPNSAIYLTVDVTKSFLRYTEHPPDAQRGWDLPPAVFVPLEIQGNLTYTGRRIYTPTLLVDLATPDFSMPYNVIIFSCSLIAFIFGSVFNLLTRKFVIVEFGAGSKAST